ncbi:MAG: OmpA family protein [Sulfuricaulis sp.]|uniref:OmpA family protein n=1 Tax=Sulfuricaulis sp. TaxID=2003553 RepID=UPI003C5BE027
MQNYRFFSTALLAIATLAGCASVPENSLLNEARNDYRAAQNNPQVINLAPNELKQAGDALAKANDASIKKEDAAVVTHLAYLAKQRAAIAQEAAKQKEAEINVTNAAAERSTIRLEARTVEANKARQSAEASQESAAESQRQAEASQQQAVTSQQQSEMSQQQARDAEMRTSQLETQLKELNAKKTERGLVITLGDVLFDTNKAQLKSGSTRSMQKLADFLKQYPQRKARIEGYTDSTGSADYNQALSDRRAKAVRTSLVDMGISNDRISTQGYGEESPVASNDTAAGRQLNRRVEIVLSDDNGNFSLR